MTRIQLLSPKDAERKIKPMCTDYPFVRPPEQAAYVVAKESFQKYVKGTEREMYGGRNTPIQTLSAQSSYASLGEGNQLSRLYTARKQLREEVRIDHENRSNEWVPRRIP